MMNNVLCVVVVERILTVPSSAEIAKIDNESFHQQKFKSVAGSLTAKVTIAIQLGVLYLTVPGNKQIAEQELFIDDITPSSYHQQ